MNVNRLVNGSTRRKTFVGDSLSTTNPKSTGRGLTSCSTTRPPGSDLTFRQFCNYVPEQILTSQETVCPMESGYRLSMIALSVKPKTPLSTHFSEALGTYLSLRVLLSQILRSLHGTHTSTAFQRVLLNVHSKIYAVDVSEIYTANEKYC